MIASLAQSLGSAAGQAVIRATPAIALAAIALIPARLAWSLLA